MTLGNTAGKLIAKLQNAALVDAVASRVADSQFGRVAGRLPSDAVQKAERGVGPLGDGGHECFDLALGPEDRLPFPDPPLLEVVLCQTGMPSFFRRAIRGNYRRVVARVRLGGLEHGEIRIRRGIKQDCPMSGTF